MFISGAFAIFVSSGVSFRKALCLLSTCYFFSYVGVVVGAILGTSLNLTVWIFAVIAGMFLYIALAEMVSGTYSCFRFPNLSLSLSWKRHCVSFLWRCSLSYQELGNDDGDGNGNENFQGPICLHYTG